MNLAITTKFPMITCSHRCSSRNPLESPRRRHGDGRPRTPSTCLTRSGTTERAPQGSQQPSGASGSSSGRTSTLRPAWLDSLTRSWRRNLGSRIGRQSTSFRSCLTWVFSSLFSADRQGAKRQMPIESFLHLVKTYLVHWSAKASALECKSWCTPLHSFSTFPTGRVSNPSPVGEVCQQGSGRWPRARLDRRHAPRPFPEGMGRPFLKGFPDPTKLEAEPCRRQPITDVNEATRLGRQRGSRVEWCDECQAFHVKAVQLEGPSAWLQDPEPFQ
jgi:hypothetical protein